MSKIYYLAILITAFSLSNSGRGEHGGGGGQMNQQSNGFNGGMALGGGGMGGGMGGGGGSYQKNQDVNKTGETLKELSKGMAELSKNVTEAAQKGTESLMHNIETASKIPEAGEETLKKMAELSKSPDGTGVGKASVEAMKKEIQDLSNTQIATIQSVAKGFSDKPTAVPDDAVASRADVLASRGKNSSARGLGANPTTALGPARKPASGDHSPGGEPYNNPLPSNE